MIKKCNKFTHASKFYPRNFAVCSVDEAWLGGIAGVGGKFKDSNLMITKKSLNLTSKGRFLIY